MEFSEYYNSSENSDVCIVLSWDASNSSERRAGSKRSAEEISEAEEETVFGHAIILKRSSPKFR